MSSALPKPASAEPPLLWDPGHQVTKPNLDGLVRLRFLTTLDYPPFNFADENKKPTGFNVDLARAICAELDITTKCEIQAMPWEELDGALSGRRAEVIIAGLNVSAANRVRYRLSEPYFRFPARFVARQSSRLAPDTPLAGLAASNRIGVVENSAHAAFLGDAMGSATIVRFADQTSLYGALQSGEVDLLFGDGVTLSFWLTSVNADGCCRFQGEPVYDDTYFGRGMAIGMRLGEPVLQQAINAALSELEAKGVTAELFARYFPVSPYGF
ncbi:MAG: transporter substrate-binding domain-containing protein [Pseudomonadota bacterium]